MAELESVLQNKVIPKIKEIYGEDVWVYKTHDQCRIGVLDVILCFYGHFVSFELKRKKKEKSIGDPKMSKLQEYNSKKIIRAGGSSFSADNVSTILERLGNIYKNIQERR
jgi:hypothetical protein